jgi:Chromatin assembly factor 1 subunit A
MLFSDLMSSQGPLIKVEVIFKETCCSIAQFCPLTQDSNSDVMMKYLGFFEKRSFILTPRNPLKKDETVIDYEMDSEEEWNE